MALPLAYLLTFTSYGSHLHGAEGGSVDRDHNQVGSRGVDPNPAWVSVSRAVMTDGCYGFNANRRGIVLKAIQRVCAHRQWELLAAHVRTTHVHAVVIAPVQPDTVLHDFKAYAARALNETEGSCRRWTRHGSTRFLWTREDVEAAVDYVIRRQGEPMALHDPRSMTVAAR